VEKFKGGWMSAVDVCVLGSHQLYIMCWG